MPAARVPRARDYDEVVDLLVPLELDDHPWVEGLAGLNERAATWCAEVNAVVHSDIHAVPAQRLATESELLAGLPSLRLEVGAKPTTRKVDKLSCTRLYGFVRGGRPSPQTYSASETSHSSSSAVVDTLLGI